MPCEKDHIVIGCGILQHGLTDIAEHTLGKNWSALRQRENQVEITSGNKNMIENSSLLGEESTLH